MYHIFSCIVITIISEKKLMTHYISIAYFIYIYIYILCVCVCVCVKLATKVERNPKALFSMATILRCREGC